ncbi:peptidase M24 [candidate division KSB3 bacterium]|uniref:Peptidase M24 n=1 Tax=candidate division KSB3 bacterium TaxID=2044937 RepID=A0A2G6EAS2_9BACT|nr:MAG: peptidase M24 [candidate division KSB3 bacterium]PIE31003.1 MAG: peptidase M24 [candidate division KSB3 bacterium]
MTKMTTQDRLSALRDVMAGQNIDAWIAADSDPHQSEYPASHWKTRAWLSGFTGSAGTLVVTRENAALWTDFRYFIQAERQLAGSGIELFKMKMPGVPSLYAWLRQALQENDVLGFDGWVFSAAEAEKLQRAVAAKHIRIACDRDLAAQVWTERPAIPGEKISILDVKFSGASRQSKCSRVRDKMTDLGVQGHLISSLDEIAWLLNIRGRDIAYNPVAIAYLYLSQEEAHLFVAPEKLSEEILALLASDGIMCSDYDALPRFLKQIPADTTLLIDPQRTSQAVRELLAQRCTIIEGENIALPLKAIKNACEQEGFRQAHIRDGVAMVKWLFWLNQHVGRQVLSEMTIVEPLEEFRSQQSFFQGLSFNTISAYQANSALCHYAAKPETALTIEAAGMLLVDSGAQYLDGTTDITRTMTLSEASAQQRRDFTYVLKGHIALATAQFPKGTSGAQLDTLARIALWKQGLDYGHGTGHGLGHFLSVHEGPQSIRPENTEPLRLGMVCSNEPGLYREGQYGIRIENVVIVVPAEETEFGSFYQFETISLCPIDRRLIDASRLTQPEKDWLNAYHRRVCDTLSPFLTSNEQAWLAEAAQEI